MKKVIILAILLVIGLFLVFLITRSTKSKDKAYQISTSEQTIIKEIKALNRLETAQFTIEKVIDAGTQENRFKDILFGDRILLLAHGTVTAGFDLSQLNEDDVDVTGSSIVLRLPSPRILTTKLDNEQTRVYDRKLGLLSKGDKDLETQARRAAEDVIRQGACDGDILLEANQNGKKQLTALLKVLQFSEIQIITSEGSCE